MQIEIEDKRAINIVEKAVIALLRDRHSIRTGDKDDFIIENAATLLQKVQEQLSSMALFLASIAVLSLFVGGVGIMNIMLISVAQRTREIGIRKALGATYRHILIQFLIESLIIGAIGSTLGVASGFGITFLVATFMKLPVVLSLKATFWAVGVALLTNLFFGIWPAHRAALLDPIKALQDGT